MNLMPRYVQFLLVCSPIYEFCFKIESEYIFIDNILFAMIIIGYHYLLSYVKLVNTFFFPD